MQSFLSFCMLVLVQKSIIFQFCGGKFDLKIILTQNKVCSRVSISAFKTNTLAGMMGADCSLKMMLGFSNLNILLSVRFNVFVDGVCVCVWGGGNLQGPLPRSVFNGNLPLTFTFSHEAISRTTGPRF